MAAPSGISAQLGYKSESTWGTAVTVDQFLPFNSEGITKTIARLESQGIRAGRRTKHTWKAGGVICGGPIALELPNYGLATLLRHMFGTIATTGVDPYTHTASPGDLAGKALTIQVGRPDTGGTVRAFTYNGCKIPQWEIACSAGEIAMLNLTISAKDETTATALATASYPADYEPFVFTEGSLSIAGSAVATVRSMNLAAQNSLRTEQHFVGSSTVSEQKETSLRDYTGSLTADFESLTAYERYTAGTEAALVMAFDNGTDSLTITTNVRFDGDTPAVGGIDILEQSLPFVCTSGTGDDSTIEAVLVNGESSSA